ncbi:ABC transporter permease [Streptomyces sp. NPDC020379]|uniref:ABC transporter permease n=1 Tax=Streptomyces sp. NPDC020379 TaxID=3365071 RepID=UPI0037BB9758
MIPTLTPAFTQLVRANSRELFRDGKTIFFVLLFPLLFVAMFIGIGLLNTGGSYKMAVTPARNQQEIVRELSHSSGFKAEPWHRKSLPENGDLAGYDAIVHPSATAGDRALVVVDSAKFGALKGIRSALGHSGISASKVDFRTPDGGKPFDPIRISLPTALLMALMSMAFFGTATPLIALRARGTLRLLGTTPLRRRTFVLAQAPVRLALVAVQLVVLGAIAVGLGFLPAVDAARVLGTGFLGAVMLFAFGYLVAARMRNAEVANGLLAVLMPLVLFASGLFLPLDLLPSVVRDVSKALPTTYLVDALTHDLTGAPSTYGLTLDWLVLLAGAVLFGGLAARLFSWDQGEER